MKHKRELTAVTEDYLRAIYSVQEWDEGGVSVTELANIMGVVPSTASENVRKLRDAGFINHQPYQRVCLTELGHEEAVKMVRRHRILETFLNRFLDFSWDEVHEEAENLEHAVSDRFVDKLDEALGFPALDPHGDPIPRRDGSMAKSKAVNLTQVEPGQDLQVVRIRDSKPEVLRYFEQRQIVPGAQIKVVERSEVADVISIMVADQQVDLSHALGSSVAAIPSTPTAGSKGE